MNEPFGNSEKIVVCDIVTTSRNYSDNNMEHVLNLLHEALGLGEWYYRNKFKIKINNLMGNPNRKSVTITATLLLLCI